MNLMTWFRKHNRKIMAVVVIALMVVFTIQPVMNYLSSRRSGVNKVVAYYDDGSKIKNEDISLGQKQLELLKALGINAVLQPRDLRIAPSQDLRQILLGELLFSDRTTAAGSISLIRQIISRNGLSVSEEQINAIYTKAYPANLYWLLLSKEAQLAGIRMAPEVAKEQLERIITQILQGATYSQAMEAITKRYGVSEQQVVETFTDLMGIIECCRMMTSVPDTTSGQLLQETVIGIETIDAQYVIFKADTYTSDAPQPGDEKVTEQFEKYKGFYAGEINDDNPYGFGYKLPDRVKLEYIAVRLEDVAAMIQRPTQQEMEDYYQQHLSQPPIAYMAPSDPEDPNSQRVWKTRSYPEVAASISKGIYLQRIDSKAEQILLEAKSITEVNLMGIDRERTKLHSEDVKKLSVDYEKTAEDLSEKYKLKIYAGKTGFLSAADILNDEYLSQLYLRGAGVTSASLSEVVFSVEPLKASYSSPFGMQPPLLYENIGPLKDRREMMIGYSGSNMMLMRVIEVERASEPKGLNETINKQAVVFDRPKTAEDVNTVRNTVVKDLKMLAAMDIAGTKAREFAVEANKAGWDTAVEKFNENYLKTVGKTEQDTDKAANPFRLRNRRGLRRISDEQIDTLAVHYEGDPMRRGVLARAAKERLFIDELYSLVPQDANVLETTGAILEFRPEMSCYCVKDIVIHRLTEDEYGRLKAMSAVEDEARNAQSLGVVYFNPENIMKRMNFRLKEERQGASEPNSMNDVNLMPQAAEEY